MADVNVLLSCTSLLRDIYFVSTILTMYGSRLSLNAHAPSTTIMFGLCKYATGSETTSISSPQCLHFGPQPGEKRPPQLQFGKVLDIWSSNS